MDEYLNNPPTPRKETPVWVALVALIGSPVVLFVAGVVLT